MDIIVSIVMIAVAIYLYVLVGAQSPAATETELGAAFWPHIILILMILLSLVNLYQAFKKMKAEGGKLTDGIDLSGFFKSKLLVGMVAVVIMAVLLPIIGFIPTCLLFLIGYGFLLGERRIPRMILISLILTVVIYIVFQGALDIMLPRGTGFFRSFALTIETILPF